MTTTMDLTTGNETQIETDNESTTATSARDVVVGYDAEDPASMTALDKAIAHARADDDIRLVVVHASSSPVMVYDGPSTEIARAMGEPAWAMVYTTAMQRGAIPERTRTIVEPGDPMIVLARYCLDASVVYLGPSRRRFRRSRSLGRRLGAVVNCPVVQVADEQTTTEARARRPEPSSSLNLQPGVS